MELDPATCYRALSTRDARFDGRFFTCVATTGIYCRPVCPARTPLDRNCSFVSSAAAAQQAGFRPCLRCRPECAPGAPAWRGTGAVVSRALKMISDGALDDGGVDELAGRAGLGARHLRRLVRAHTGASPVELARTRRILFAKRLITETGLNITDIAFASGFRSIRRFNSEMAAALGRPPRELRRHEGGAQAGPVLSLPLSFRPPYDWEGVLAFLRARAVPGLEEVSDGAYRRSFVLGKARGWFEISPMPGRNALLARIETDRLDTLDILVGRIRSMFDLDADPQAILEDLGKDEVIGPWIAQAPGLRLVQSFDAFEAGVRAIVGQQISVRGAATLLGRLVALAGGSFPQASDMAEADLSGVGLTSARLATLKSWAEFASGPGAIDSLRFDLGDAVRTLTALPGIGPWTAQYICLRGLSHTDAFPSGDLVLRQRSGLTDQELERMSERWRPWRAYAAQTIWRVAPTTPRKDN
jgi:AraC family transcriptional regulator of adaptative response / DNA-3-methyladenine glycosylase II